MFVLMVAGMAFADDAFEALPEPGEVIRDEALTPAPPARPMQPYLVSTVDVALERVRREAVQCYVTQAARLSPRVQADVIVYIMTGDDGTFAVMGHDEYSSVQSEKGDDCLQRALKPYRLSGPHNNVDMVKRTIIIPRPPEPQG